MMSFLWDIAITAICTFRLDQALFAKPVSNNTKHGSPTSGPGNYHPLKQTPTQRSPPSEKYYLHPFR